MVRAEGSRPRGRGFESRRILDGCKRLHCTMRITKIKVAKWGTPKKNIKKKKIYIYYKSYINKAIF